jgi:hypothetical protein
MTKTAQRRGRPPLDPTDRSVKLSITIPSRQFDTYCTQATKACVSVPEIIRRELKGNKALQNSGR